MNDKRIRKLAKDKQWWPHKTRATGLWDFGNMQCFPRAEIRSLTDEQALAWLESDDEYPPWAWRA